MCDEFESGGFWAEMTQGLCRALELAAGSVVRGWGGKMPHPTWNDGTMVSHGLAMFSVIIRGHDFNWLLMALAATFAAN